MKYFLLEDTVVIQLDLTNILQFDSRLNPTNLEKIGGFSTPTEKEITYNHFHCG